MASTASKYYRHHAQVGPGLGVGRGEKMQFLIVLPQLRNVKQPSHSGLC